MDRNTSYVLMFNLQWRESSGDAQEGAAELSCALLSQRCVGTILTIGNTIPKHEKKRYSAVG